MHLSPAEQSARVIHRVYLAAGSAGIARDVSFADFVEENLRDHAADFVVGVVQVLQRENWCHRPHG